MPPSLLFLFTVAEIKAFPQAIPVAVRTPVLLTVANPAVFEFQITWFVISLVTGGCMKDPRALSWTFAPASWLNGIFAAPKVSAVGWIPIETNC